MSTQEELNALNTKLNITPGQSEVTVASIVAERAKEREEPKMSNMDRLLQTNSIESMVLNSEEEERMIKDAEMFARDFKEATIIEEARKQGHNVEELNDLMNLKYATKDEFNDLVSKGILTVAKQNVTSEDGQTNTILVAVEPTKKEEATIEPTVAVTQGVKETNITQFTAKRSSLVSINNDNKVERIKNRRRKGRCSTGFLHNTNVLVQCYDLDKPLMMDELVNGFMYLTATLFHSKKMFNRLFEHTSVICADGAKAVNTADKFFDIMAVDDFEDYLLYMLISSNDNGLLKQLDLRCVDSSETVKGCGHKFKSDIDLIDGVNKLITPERRTRYNKYDKNKTLSEIMKDSFVGAQEVVVVKDNMRDETIVIRVSTPTVNKYFDMKDNLMNYIYDTLMADEDVRFRVLATVDKIQNRSIDERIRILASIDREKYTAVAEGINVMVYIDDIMIVPNDVYSLYMTSTHPVYKTLADFKDNVDGVTLISPTQGDDIDSLHELFIDLDEEMVIAIKDTIAKITSKLSRTEFLIERDCPSCGNHVSQLLSATELFFIFLNQKGLIQNGTK